MRIQFNIKAFKEIIDYLNACLSITVSNAAPLPPMPSSPVITNPEQLARGNYLSMLSKHDIDNTIPAQQGEWYWVEKRFRLWWAGSGTRPDPSNNRETASEMKMIIKTLTGVMLDEVRAVRWEPDTEKEAYEMQHQLHYLHFRAGGT